MKVICGVDASSDRTFISFVGLQAKNVVLLDEIEVDIILSNTDILKFLRDNAGVITGAIKDRADELRARVSKIFLSLPAGMESRLIVEEVFPLNRRKKIGPRDIFLARKHVEDVRLDWDDFCLHNLTFGYEVDGKFYQRPPLGVWSDKIKIISLLFWVKDRLRREIKEVFDNVDMHLGGLISGAVSVLSGSFSGLPAAGAMAAIHIGYQESSLVVWSGERFEAREKIDFSATKIMSEIERNFSLSREIGKEIFDRYLSFNDVPVFKEISLRQEDAYLNLSSQALNSFVKSYVKRELSAILQNAVDVCGTDKYSLSASGRLNNKDGFEAVVREVLPENAVAIVPKSNLSLSFGCARYGVNRFLEDTFADGRLPGWFAYLLNVYRDYF